MVEQLVGAQPPGDEGRWPRAEGQAVDVVNAVGRQGALRRGDPHQQRKNCKRQEACYGSTTSARLQTYLLLLVG